MVIIKIIPTVILMKDKEFDMNDFEKIVPDIDSLIRELLNYIEKEKCIIRLINIKLHTQSEESRWYYDVKLEVHHRKLLVKELESVYYFDCEQITMVKVRPFYFAACIGNKNLVFTVRTND